MSKGTDGNITAFEVYWFVVVVFVAEYVCSIFNRVAYACDDIVSTILCNIIHIRIPIGAITNISLKQGIATPELLKPIIMLNSINI